MQRSVLSDAVYRNNVLERRGGGVDHVDGRRGRASLRLYALIIRNFHFNT